MKVFILFACFIATVSAACRECGENEIACPVGKGDDGCPKYLFCENPDHGVVGDDGTMCPINCPVICEPTEVSCNSFDANGCFSVTCIPKAGGNCPTWCPLDCTLLPGDLVNCPGEIDSDGCRRPDNCIPAGDFCFH